MACGFLRRRDSDKAGGTCGTVIRKKLRFVRPKIKMVVLTRDFCGIC